MGNNLSVRVVQAQSTAKKQSKDGTHTVRGYKVQSVNNAISILQKGDKSYRAVDKKGNDLTGKISIGQLEARMRRGTVKIEEIKNPEKNGNWKLPLSPSQQQAFEQGGTDIPYNPKNPNSPRTGKNYKKKK